MEFLKKNWARLLIAAVALTGAVLMLVPVFMASKIEFFGACQTIGIILFFVGLAVGVCLKIGDKTQNYAKYVAVCASALVLIFMSIGLLGFCEDKEKAHGALGNAYATYESAPSNIAAGQEKIATLTQALGGLTALATSGQGGQSMTTLKSGALGADAKAMAENLVASGLVKDATTVSDALLIVGTAKAIAESQLPTDIEATKKDASAGALTVLFAYVSMMFAFGLIPLIKGIQKSFFQRDAK